METLKIKTISRIACLITITFLFNFAYSQSGNTINNISTAIVKSENTTIPVQTSSTTAPNEVRILKSSLPQSEIHISINKFNPQILLLSSNTNQIGNCIQGAYWSTNGGTSWTGADALPNNAGGKGDPSTAFDAKGTGYIATMTPVSSNFSAEPIGYSIQKTSDNGITWNLQVNGAINIPLDKEMIAADDLPSSPFANNLYCAWRGANKYVQFNRSTDQGNTFSAPLTFTNYWGQGANVQTGINGEVYVCWADYNGNQIHDYSAKGLGFCLSTNGGQTFTTAKRVINFIGIRQYNSSTGYEENPLFNNIRVNDFPSMAVDKSSGVHRGRIYVTLPAKQNGNGKAVVLLSYSDNQGTTWSTPSVISISNATQSFFPWVTSDAATGLVYVIYYAFDQPTGFSTNTYLATSVDGGNTFTNQKVSSVPHNTAPINEFIQGYAGDYIGIAAYRLKAYPAWSDNRTGQWQNYVAKIDNTPIISGVSSFCYSATYSATNLLPNTTVSWSASPTGIVNLTPNGNNVTLTKITQGYFTLNATINELKNVNASGTVNLSTIPDCTSVTATMSGSCNGSYQTWYLSATPNMAASNWHWTVDNPSSANYNIYNPYSQSTYVSVSGGGGGISVTYTDPCGETSRREGATIYSPCARGYAFVAYPNPASSQLSVKFNTAPPGVQALSTDNNALSVVNTNFIAELYDGQGRLLKKSQTQSNENEITFNTSDLVNGTYYLHIKSGSDLIEKQVYIKH